MRQYIVRSGGGIDYDWANDHIFKRIFAILGAAVMLATIVPATFAASPGKPPSQATAIVGIAAGNHAFSALVAAVTCADPAVLQALTSGEQLTVFAPTNDAFAKLGLNDNNICSALPEGALTQIRSTMSRTAAPSRTPSCRRRQAT